MIRLVITDWSDTQMTELKALFDYCTAKEYDARLSFEKTEEPLDTG